MHQSSKASYDQFSFSWESRSFPVTFCSFLFGWINHVVFGPEYKNWISKKKKKKKILRLITKYTTKKRDYPNVLKTTGIAPKSTGIRSKFLSWRFLSRRFKLLRFECQNRVAGPIPALFNSAGIGPSAF